MQDTIDPAVWRARRERMKARHPGMGDMGLPLGLAVRLLPTPRTSDTNGASSHGDGGPDLRTAVSLLPTPQASERSASRETAEERAAAGHQAYLSHVMTSLTRSEPAPQEGGTHWGPYAAAVERWEALTRPAPRPVDEQGRLSPAFVEWLMGLADGHVTTVPGLSRGARLKALGNGVVPQQAAAALRLLLDRFDDA
ncbi:hypothetical protein AB0N09_31655 [Streptomyces erythrochromogenes]|uniref:hypothetical protein n=1 Tax=Streptomyces erythrochromogenes TaxID=285574 RepID=UPI0034378F24